jgi:hypothetical protein
MGGSLEEQARKLIAEERRRRREELKEDQQRRAAYERIEKAREDSKRLAREYVELAKECGVKPIPLHYGDVLKTRTKAEYFICLVWVVKRGGLYNWRQRRTPEGIAVNEKGEAYYFESHVYDRGDPLGPDHPQAPPDNKGRFHVLISSGEFGPVYTSKFGWRDILAKAAVPLIRARKQRR